MITGELELIGRHMYECIHEQIHCGLRLGKCDLMFQILIGQRTIISSEGLRTFHLLCLHKKSPPY